jgi:hypothetical protein
VLSVGVASSTSHRLLRRAERAVRWVVARVSLVLAQVAREHLADYVQTETYTPLRGLDAWLIAHGDAEGLLRAAISPVVDARYETRVVDVREPALLERRNGYLFVRRGLCRESFNWWQLDAGPRPRALVAFVRWWLAPPRARHRVVVSMRTRWEGNFWHCHDEVLSKLVLVDRLDLPRTTPLLVGPDLWRQPFFQAMIEAPALRDRNWVVHDAEVSADRVILCIQGPTQPENARFVRSCLRPPMASEFEPTSHPRRLLVLRGSTVERRFSNEDEVLGALEPLGFRGMCADDLPFWDQVQLFAQAQCVVLAHGAALAHLVHRIDAVTGVIEVFPRDPDYVKRVYGPWMAKSFGFAYRAVVGSAMEESGEFSVPPVVLHDAVVAVLGEVERAERASQGGAVGAPHVD